MDFEIGKIFIIIRNSIRRRWSRVLIEMDYAKPNSPILQEFLYD
jgi:hypothetical protein